VHPEDHHDGEEGQEPGALPLPRSGPEGRGAARGPPPRREQGEGEPDPDEAEVGEGLGPVAVGVLDDEVIAGDPLARDGEPAGTGAAPAVGARHPPRLLPVAGVGARRGRQPRRPARRLGVGVREVVPGRGDLPGNAAGTRLQRAEPGEEAEGEDEEDGEAGASATAGRKGELGVQEPEREPHSGEDEDEEEDEDRERAARVLPRRERDPGVGQGGVPEGPDRGEDGAHDGGGEDREPPQPQRHDREPEHEPGHEGQ